MHTSTGTYCGEDDRITTRVNDEADPRWAVTVTIHQPSFGSTSTLYLSEEQAYKLARDIFADLDGLQHDRDEEAALIARQSGE